MLTPARKANSRCRGSPGVSGSIGWPSGRIAQGPARSLEAMMIGDTPSPPGARRDAASRRARGILVVVAARQRLDPGLAGVEAAGEVAQQIECLGQHMFARYRLEFGH